MENPILPPVVIGIDISKKKFDLALLRHDKLKHKTFVNQTSGFDALQRWLHTYDVQHAHVCMESTNIYGEALAEYLVDHGYTVSIVNPARVKGFAQSELARTKTDKTDAGRIARFCAAMHPAPWTPDPLEIRQLRAMVRRLDALVVMKQQEINRQQVAPDILLPQLQDHIAYLDQRIRDTKKQIADHIDRHPDLKNKKALLTSIPGIGEATINVVLAEFASIDKFKNAKALSAFIGVAPRERQSGTSVHQRTTLCKTGRTQLRKTFFMPALVALRYNPSVMAMKQRLTAAGKPKMAIVGAAMRKLVHLIYGVLKSGVPFDGQYTSKSVDG